MIIRWPMAIVSWFALSVLIAGCTGNDTSKNQSIQGPPALRVNVTFISDKFAVNNGNEFAWKNCTLSFFTDNSSTGPFELRNVNVDPGQTYETTASELSTANDLRYDFKTMKIKKLKVVCDTPNGKSEGGASW